MPSDWASADDVASFNVTSSESLPVPQAMSIALEAGYAAISGLKGDVAIFSLEAAKVERSLRVDEPVTDTAWTGQSVIFATSKGSVKVFQGGNQVASFSEHAGPATALALHPGGEILASVGTDKSFIFYDLEALKRVTRVYTESCEFTL